MKKVSRRALFALALAIVLAAGTLAFCVKYAANADQWVTFSGSPHVYTGTNLTGGKIYDRTGARILNTVRALGKREEQLREHGLVDARKHIKRGQHIDRQSLKPRKEPADILHQTTDLT